MCFAVASFFSRFFLFFLPQGFDADAAVPVAESSAGDGLSYEEMPLTDLDRPQTCWQRCKRGGVGGKRIPKWVVNNVLLFSFMWQCIVVLLYRVAFNDAFSEQGIPFDVGVAVMILMQVVQLVFIIIISVKLSKQVLHHTVTNWFLVQTYLATILLFAGVYTVIERAAPSSFVGVFEPGDSAVHALVTIRFLYFSCQVMTTTGFGDIRSAAWYADLLVIVQMLLSVLYTTIIFSKGLSFFSLEPPPPRRKKRQERAPEIQ